MLTKQDKNRLKQAANHLKPIVIIGKDGMSSNLVQTIQQVF